MTTDKQVKAALAERWTAGATAVGESVRIIPRWKLSLTGHEVLSALSSLADNKKVNGVLISRVKRKSRKLGANHFEYQWTYAMFYFRSYEDGDASYNSEDKANELLEAVAEELENNGDLGLEDVDDHSQLQVENIDTIDLKVHAVQCFITVTLTKQP